MTDDSPKWPDGSPRLINGKPGIPNRFPRLEAPAPAKRPFMRPGSWIVLAIVLIVGVFAVWPDSEASAEHPLDGSVLILNSQNFTATGTACQGTGLLFDLVSGTPVKITPKGKSPILTTLGRGVVTSEGNCRLKFTPTIPEASSYLFEVGSRVPIERNRSFIDGSNGSGTGSWWITLGWDADE